MRLKVIEKGPWEGKEVLLKPGVGVTLGTDPSCTLSFPGAAGVEGVHCVIRALKQGGFGVKDLGSQEGTFLNGKRVKVARLSPGDLLRVGTVTLEVLEGETEKKLPTATSGEEAPGEGKAPSAASSAAPPPKRPKGKLPPRKRDLERVGTEIGGYKILEFLGRGGMGTVYRALQVSLQREVALKLLRRERTKDPAFVEDFVREARAAARFNHPNVVHVYDVGHEGDVYFYSMELMDRGSLEEELAERGKLPWEEALKVIRDAARGLRYAEEMGVVHRDIKPDNLMRNSQGMTKIADLGLAAATGETSEGGEGEEKKKIFGTPHFISPEQARGEAVDVRSDIYSLGCTFYRLVTGKTPFQGETVREILKKHFTEEPEPASQVEPSVPEAVSRVIQKMMAKDPAERHQSAQELLADLDRLSGKRGGLKWALVLLLAGIAAAALALAFCKREPVIIEKPAPENTNLKEKVREVERTRRELEAQKALLEAAALAEGPGKAARLEEIASKYPRTEAGKKAAARAAALRKKLARIEKARQEKAARVRNCISALRKSLAEAEKAGDGRVFFKAVRGIPGLSALGSEPRVAKALAATRAKAAALVDETLAGILGKAGALLKKPDLEGAAKALEAARKLLADPVLPGDLRGKLKKRYSPKIALFAGILAREKEKARALQVKADREIFFKDLYRGPESALARSARFDFDGALQAARALAKKLHTKAFHGLLSARIAQIQGAARAWKAFLAGLAKGGAPPLRLDGADWKILSLREGNTLLLEKIETTGRGKRRPRRKKKKTSPPRRQLRIDETLLLQRPGTLAALLDPGPRGVKDPAALGELAELCAWIGPLPLVRRARWWMKKIDPADPRSGLSPLTPVFEAPLLDLAARILRDAPGALPPERARLVRDEVEAARLLSAGLRALAAGRNLEAKNALARIPAEYAGSVIYGLLGEGSALDPDRPPNTPKR